MVVKHFDNQHPRFATIKSSFAAPAYIPCFFGELQGKHLFAEGQTALPSGSTVTVEYDDTLFLGEVVVCKANVDSWTFEIKVEQILSGLQSLMALRSQLLGEMPAAQPVASNPFAQAFAVR